jgi:hypothetical protein
MARIRRMGRTPAAIDSCNSCYSWLTLGEDWQVRGGEKQRTVIFQPSAGEENGRLW